MLRQLVVGAGRVGRAVAREQGLGKVIQGRAADLHRTALSSFHTSIPHWRADADETEPSTAEVADFDKPQERTVGNEKVMKIADDILGLSMLEAHDLMEVLKDRLGITGQPMYGVAAGAMPGGAAAAEEPVEEKTDFDVKLEGFDASAKIKIIKEIRGVTDLGLKEAKELVEGAPCVIKKGLKKEEAEAVAEKLKAAGATVVLE